MDTKTIFKNKEAFNARAPLQIDAITVKHVQDDSCPSFLGEYSYTPAEHSIDRKAVGDWKQGEYRYFNIGSGDPEYLEQDYKRYEAYNNGEWHMVGIVAECEVSYECFAGSRRLERFTSSGLWGIESDSGEDYFSELEREQLDDLKGHVAKFGVPWPI